MSTSEESKPKFTYDYPRPACTADFVGMYTNNRDNPTFENTYVLLVERKNKPFGWALPGGFMNIDEQLSTTALRELFEETHVSVVSHKFLSYYDAPNRDRRTRVITFVFGKVFNYEPKTKAGDDAKSCGFHLLNKLPKIVFDHKKIITESFYKLFDNKGMGLV